MPRRSRRRFVAAVCASLLYGARQAFASEAGASLPRIGVLLPLSSHSFGRAAESLQRGFEHAARLETDSGFDIVIYATTEDPANVLTGYERALADGPQLVVGPLTRNGVTALARNLRAGTPVLALNAPEDEAILPQGMLAFSLQVENEARKVAQMAFADGRRTALTIVDDQALMGRIERAFVEQFLKEGGQVIGQFAYRTSTADLMALREAASSGGVDTVFLALDGPRARLAVSYARGTAQVYATSQILDGRPDRIRDAELNGVRFVAMPWLLERDHPAVMAYAGAGADFPAATDLERLYAFGIDAYRLAAAYLRGNDLARDPLDGVTGRLLLQGDGHFARELTPAQIVDGLPVPLARTR
jgi:uncharacterized protein